MSEDGNFTNHIADRESKIAFWLEHISPDDPDLPRVLTENYASDIFGLVCTLFDLPDRKVIQDMIRSDSKKSYDSNKDKGQSLEDCLMVTKQVFALAIDGMEEFRGEIGVRVWLYRLAVREGRAYRRQRKWKRERERKLVDVEWRQVLPGDSQPLSALETCIWGGLEDLTENQRLAVMLRYAHQLSVADIAHILSCKPQDVENYLATARGKFQERLDASDQSQVKTEQFEAELFQVFQSHLDEPILPQSGLEQLLTLLEVERSTPHIGVQLWARSREGLMVGLVLLIVFFVGWYLTRQDTHVGKPIFSTTPHPTPTPVEIPALFIRQIPGLQDEASGPGHHQIIHYVDPDISADGLWIVYTLSSTTLDFGEISNENGIFTYDRGSGNTQQVDLSLDGEPADGWSFASSISDNGRWIVFTSTSEDLVPGDVQTCTTENNSKCMNIYIHDRQSSTTEIVSLAYDDSRAAGHSLFPVISADGRWVAYWSNADNLVEKGQDGCNYGDQGYTCWDVYLYDRETGVTERIPVGRKGEPSITARTDKFSLAPGGRWLVMTLKNNDQAAKPLQMVNEVDLFLYDRWLGIYEPVNVNNDGGPGDSMSFYPAFSSTGRFLAFVSQADNLVPEDNNRLADVFVRDMQSATVEMVSVASDGTQGDDHSGILAQDFDVWGEGVDISSDGRYVTFVSNAQNLAAHQVHTCRTGGDFLCPNVYVRDREESITEFVVTEPQANSFYIFPGISSDGRWVTVVKYDLDCPGKPLCAYILLHDREYGLTTTLATGERPVSQEGSIPWETKYVSDEPDGSVNSVAFAPDGESLAAGSSDGSVRIWRAVDGANLHILRGHRQSVTSVAISPDGELLASGSRDGSIIIWRVSDGALVNRLEGYTDAIHCLVFSPDGEMLAVGAVRAAWNWEISDISSTVLDFMEYPGDQVRSIAFSPNGELIVHGISDGTLWLRRVSDGGVISRLDGHSAGIQKILFSPDGNYLASGSQDNTVNLWRIERITADGWKAYRGLTFQYSDWVNDLAFSPDGSVLAVAAFDSSVRLWRVPEGELTGLSLSSQWFQPMSLAFSPDGRTLAVGSALGGLQLWRQGGY